MDENPVQGVIADVNDANYDTNENFSPLSINTKLRISLWIFVNFVIAPMEYSGPVETDS
jgi:hypothetical protein